MKVQILVGYSDDDSEVKKYESMGLDAPSDSEPHEYMDAIISEATLLPTTLLFAYLSKNKGTDEMDIRCQFKMGFDVNFKYTDELWEKINELNQ